MGTVVQHHFLELSSDGTVSFISSPRIASSTPVLTLTFSRPSPRTLPSGSASTFNASSCEPSSATGAGGAVRDDVAPGCRLPLSFSFFSFWGGGG
jgi:hypothetical protein